jgi:hypothetical protein
MYHLFNDPIDQQQVICTDSNIDFAKDWYATLGFKIDIIKSANTVMELANYIYLYTFSLN